MAGVGQADLLVDFGFEAPPDPVETDGKVWNCAAHAPPGGSWAPVMSNVPDGDSYLPLGELVDHTGAPSGVYCEALDIPFEGDEGTNGPSHPSYPANVTYDWWNGQGFMDGNPAGIKLKGVAPGTYDMNIWVGYPCDLRWVDGAGKYTVQGQTQTFMDDPDPVDVWDPVLMTFTGLTPQGPDNEIVLWMEYAFPGARPGLPTFNAIMMMELVPEPTTMMLLAAGGLLAIRRRR